MNSSVSIYHCHNGDILVTTIVDDSKVIKEKLSNPPPKWDMSTIPVPIGRFTLGLKQNISFTKALFSKEGKSILQRMKTENAESIIHTFLLGYKKKMPINRSLTNFVDQILNEPLKGVILIKNQILGITKKQMYEEFVKQGIIKE